MKILIAYYSRTSTTAKLAAAIANALDADTVKVDCQKYHVPGVGYLLAGYDSLNGNLPHITIPPVDFSSYDLVVLGSPIWTSYPALPLRSLLAKKPALKRAAAFVTFGGHSTPEKAFNMIGENLNVELEATLSVQHDDANEGNFNDSVTTFAAKVRSIDSK